MRVIFAALVEVRHVGGDWMNIRPRPRPFFYSIATLLLSEPLIE
jgi:hypothetical protein